MIHNQGELLRKFFSSKTETASCKSLRELSKIVFIPASRLSEYLSGKRKMSVSSVEKIKKYLNLSIDEVNELNFSIQRFDERAIRRPTPRILSQEEFVKICNPIYFRFLALLDTHNFRNDTLWISKRINCEIDQVKEVIKTLSDLDLLFENEGKIALREFSVETQNETKSLDIQMAHEQYLKSAINALFATPIEQRNYQSIVLAVDPRKIAKVKKMTERFIDKVVRELESGHRTEVYRLSTQLYPESNLTPLENLNET